MKMGLNFPAIILLSLFSSNSFANTTSWQKEVSEDGVEVFLKATVSYEVQEFRATVKLKGEVSDVFSIFEDISSYPKWLADCLQGRLVKQINSADNVAHLIFNSPWPVEDRDVTFYRTIEKTERGGLALNFSAKDDYLDQENCCVRIVKAVGQFKVEPTEDDGTVLVSYQFVSDPGGNLPSWLMNYIVVDALLKTMKYLQNYWMSKQQEL